MKKMFTLFFIVLTVVLFQSEVSAFNQPDSNSVIKWDTILIDLGEIKEGNPAKAQFRFTNIGKAPINLVDVMPTDPMTPDYGKDSVNPGKKGWIVLRVGTEGLGLRNKSCTVRFSNGEISLLYVKWLVIPKAIQWEATNIDFGTIKKDSPCVAKYEFTNTGKDTVRITNFTTSAGGTCPDGYTKEPVAPGGSGFVRIRYDTRYPGMFEKSGSVYFNNGEAMYLIIKGNVRE
jgi:hypothetical protein